jgi:DNA-binding transcriptional ArsR family regulator
VRVMDLRASSRVAPATVEARASAAAELLRLIGVLIARDPSDFDIGVERIEAVRAQVDPTLLAAAADLGTLAPPSGSDLPDRDDKFFLVLAMLGALLPEPSGVAQLLELFGEDPTLPWRAQLAHHAQDLVDDPADLLTRVLAGEQAALEEITALAATDRGAGLRELLDRSPDEFGALVSQTVERFATEVWPALAAEAMGPIERDAAHRRQQLETTDDPAAVVLDATNGYELEPEPAGRRVVLLPSYWLRPWLVISFLDATADGDRSQPLEVISTAVADTFLALPCEAPPPRLLKLFKALSDEGRLTLLRRMTPGPISLGEAASELGIAKATAHHHLSILRQAGVVSIRGEGRATRYALRDDPPKVAQEALAAYLQPWC